jgi:gluconolactonase
MTVSRLDHGKGRIVSGVLAMKFARRLVLVLFGSTVLGGAGRPEGFPVPETVAPGAKLVEVYRGAELFEGPTWDPQGNRLYFSAIGKNKEQILRLDAPKQATVWADHAGVHGTCLSIDGRLLGVQPRRRRIVSLALGTEKGKEFQALHEDRMLNQPTDLCQAPNGDVYFTDPDFKRQKTSAVYLLRPEGQVLQALIDIPLPGSVAVALDGRTLYVSDGFRKLWRAYPIGENGGVGPGVFFLNPRTTNMNPPGGMTLDERGNLYCAGRGGVWVVSPTARELGLIAVPEYCSDVAFGGEDGKTLFLTCRRKVYSLSMAVRGAPVGPER